MTKQSKETSFIHTSIARWCCHLTKFDKKKNINKKIHTKLSICSKNNKFTATQSNQLMLWKQNLDTNVNCSLYIYPKRYLKLTMQTHLSSQMTFSGSLESSSPSYELGSIPHASRIDWAEGWSAKSFCLKSIRVVPCREMTKVAPSCLNYHNIVTLINQTEVPSLCLSRLVEIFFTKK